MIRNGIIIFLVCSLVVIPVCASAQEARDSNSAANEMTANWGIEAVSIKLTADGNMLDFRYRVTDEKKANPLLTHKVKPFLVDVSSGAKAEVVTSPKVGSLRTTRPHQTDKVYFMLFGNLGKKFKAGDKVTIIIGEFQAKGLVVQ